MRIVICIDIDDELAPIAAVTRLVHLRGATVDLLHVMDVAEREEFAEAMRPGLVRPHIREARGSADASEHTAVEELYRRGSELLSAAGAAEVMATSRAGRPERETVAQLAASPADLCVLGRRPNWEDVPSTGPKSVGRVARFVTDHAPCAVLLLR